MPLTGNVTSRQAKTSFDRWRPRTARIGPYSQRNSLDADQANRVPGRAANAPGYSTDLGEF